MDEEKKRERGGEGFLFQAEPTRSEHIYTQPFIQHCTLFTNAQQERTQTWFLFIVSTYR